MRSEIKKVLKELVKKLPASLKNGTRFLQTRLLGVFYFNVNRFVYSVS